MNLKNTHYFIDISKSWSEKVTRIERKRALLVSTILVLAICSRGQAKLESWQTCCGAVCIKVTFGLLGEETELFTIRNTLKPNSKGEISLLEIADTVKLMGLHATGIRINSGQLEKCSVPLIVHWPPKHFVVLIGLGKDKGVLIIDPPYKPRKVTVEELAKQEHRNVVAVSKHPINTKDLHIEKLKDQKTEKEEVPTEYGGLRFHSTIWNFGSVKSGLRKTYEFLFKNTNTKPITLSKVKANCACLKVVQFTEKVSPGENGVINVSLDTKGLQGYITKKIIGTIGNAGTDNEEQLLLTVSGEVSRRGELLLRPSQIYLSDLVKGSKITKSLILRRIGYDKLYLKKIKPSSPNVSIKVIDGFEADSYEAHIEMVVKAQGEFGPFEYTVLFETNSPDYPTAELRIHGNNIPHIIVEPPELFLGLMSRKNLSERNTIIVRSTTDTPFLIRDIELTTDGLIANINAMYENQTAWKITLEFSPTLHNGILQGMIILRTDDPDVTKIEVPFTGLVEY
jgi:hypothetical protein